MDTTTKKENSQDSLNSPNMLARIAKKELIQMNRTSVICPRCGESPTITKTANGERTIVSCECGYVHDVVINL